MHPGQGSVPKVLLYTDKMCIRDRFKDVALAPAPLTGKQAMDMIESLASYPLLGGYRGGAVCDKEALADLLVKISEMAAEGKDKVKELDSNPVFITEDGAAIAEALLVLDDD